MHDAQLRVPHRASSRRRGADSVAEAPPGCQAEGEEEVVGSQRLASPVVALYSSPVRNAKEFSLVTLLRLPRSAVAEIFLRLANHDANVADTDLGDFAAAEF